MGKWLIIILGVFLLFGVFASSINSGITTWRTQDLTQSFAVTTVAGQTTANVTLNNDLFQDDTSRVISITSNITGESPIATSYVAATKKLLVSALNPSATHTLAVNYYADSENSAIKAIGPFLALLIFGGLLIGIILMGKRR